ncbi:MAG TPA: UDP-N-acetylmuramate dehydrogenase [Polyangiales bacterium]|jgi:UDP-N-acetylmuramate dehydrogenase|nr:UDP-N-acetylmuramate dehydrogenase [Polyangiales bacterium]
MTAKQPAALRVPLAPLTSLQLGGAAEHFVRAEDRATLIDALRWARARSLPVTLLGGGSNVVVSDDGVPGLVIAMATRGVTRTRENERVRVRAEAGEPWDALVDACVNDALAGIECMSGIPGLVGATPIQNVGAYGQEVADTITSVEVLDRTTLEVKTLAPQACGFAYRHSAFKADPARYVVLAVELELVPDGAPTLRYAELVQALGARTKASLAETRATVLQLRAKKSMLLDPSDENGRSAGSFFTNPIVSAAQADDVMQRALQLGVAQQAADVPRYPQPDGRVKLAAGWLIERSGTRRGERHGTVGISTRHALALVHHGGGTAADLIALAREVQARVARAFAIDLAAEPVFVGFAKPPLG